MQKGERAAVNIANSIRMKRTYDPTRTFLLVEGKDDKAFFGRYVALEPGDIFVAHGKPKVIEAILELDRTGFRGALGIVDADFMVLEQQESPSPNLLMTDLHDAECMMLVSPALEHLLRELGDEKQVESFKERMGSVVDHLLAIGRAIGYLRWASARNQWSLKFEELEFSEFVREKDFSFDEGRLLDAVRRHQGGRAVPLPSTAELQAHVEALKSPSHAPWHVCCGHDLVELLSIGLRKVLGQHKAASVGRELLERQLRLAYEEGYFRDTVLYVRIREWEERNAPFRVLPPASA
jgi:hypothetical protein